MSFIAGSTCDLALSRFLVPRFLIFFLIFSYSNFQKIEATSQVFDLEQLKLEGEVLGDLAIVFHADHGRCLSAQRKQAGLRIFTSSRPSRKKTFSIQGYGDIQFKVCPIPGECQERQLRMSSQAQTVQFEGKQDFAHLRVEFLLSKTDYLCKFESHQELIPWHSIYQFQALPLPIQSLASSQISSYWIGVNLEAEYLFAQLNSDQRRALLMQAKQDGFNTIRLHKLYRHFQSLNKIQKKEFKLDLSLFFNQLRDLNLALYLDLFSLPRSDKSPRNPGYKGNIFYHKELQNELRDWIEYLSQIQVRGVSLLLSDSVKWICLLNESSLFFHEQDFDFEIELSRYADYVTENEFLSMDEFRKHTMRQFYLSFSKNLRVRGFLGEIFLSNYQLGGKDLEINAELNSSVDRHLYLDYPEFQSQSPRIKFRLPLEDFEKIVQSIGAKKEEKLYLSEVNLPYPNPFSHQLIPFLLQLAKERRLAGIWFYDYRLRSQLFHEGGLFGIQKIRSIIEPLKLFQSLLDRQNYKVEVKNQLISIENEEYLIESGWIRDENCKIALPMTRYTNKLNSQRAIYTPELGELDLYSRFGTYLKQRGGQTMRLKCPSLPEIYE